MAKNDNAVLLPGTGAVLVGEVGTALKPTYAALALFQSAGTLPSGFTDLGHTSNDDLPQFGQDGGDSTTKATWQTKSFREIITAAAVDYVTAQPLQLDNTVLNLYYGGGSSSAAYSYDLPDVAATINKSLCLCFFDGVSVWGFYAYKTSVRRDDAIAMASDDFTKLPLRFTILQAAGQKRASWIGYGLGIGS